MPTRIPFAVVFVTAIQGLLVGVPHAARACPSPRTSGGPERIEMLSPFRPLQVDEDSTLVSFEPSFHEVLSRPFEEDRPLRLRDFVLPNGRSVDLELHPVRVYEPGARYVEVGPDGRTRLGTPSVATFAGCVVGGQGNAFLAITATQLNGYLDHRGERFFLSSNGPTQDATARVAESSRCLSDPTHTLLCTALGVDTSNQMGSGGGSKRGSDVNVEIVDWFVECDEDFGALFQTSQEAADYALLLFTAASEIFLRDVGLVHRIKDQYLRIWTVTAPWGDIDDHSGWNAFKNWWSSNQNPDKDIQRSGVQLFTAPDFGGIAWVDALCDYENGYAVCGFGGSFPYPIEYRSADNWDLLIITHESGHLCGSLHTADYTPPIECDDGTGPDKGTIMGAHCAPVEDIGMRFHPRVQERIRQTTQGNPCLDHIDRELGDYDFDGVVDGVDVAVLEQCLVQGFDSEGCLEVFDLDPNGKLQLCDLAILEAWTQGLVLGQYVDPELARWHDDVVFGTCGGVPAAPNAVVIVAVNGVPRFQPLFLGTFNGHGRFTRTESIPPRLEGLVLTFQAFSLDGNSKLIVTPTAELAIH